MHIPDGFVSDPLNMTTAVLSAGVVGYALLRMKVEAKNKPASWFMFAAVSALIFASQMVNYAVGGGTSGHLVGGVLAAALLGPWAACVSMAFVLAVQAFVLGDGGILALGSNVLNMAVVGTLGGYALLSALRAKLPATRMGNMAAIALASWASIVAASAACAIELALSGTASLGPVISAMVGVHALIGVSEAVITLAVLAAVQAYRDNKGADRSLAMAGVALALMLAVFVSPFASTAPDGLETVAQAQGFAALAVE